MPKNTKPDLFSISLGKELFDVTPDGAKDMEWKCGRKWFTLSFSFYIPDRRPFRDIVTWALKKIVVVVLKC